MVSRAKKIALKIWNIIRRAVGLLLVLFLILVTILSIPWVQTKIANKVTNSVNEEYNTNIQIDRIGLRWNGDITVNGTYIEDHKKDTLVYIGQLNTSLLSVRNAMKGNLEFGSITMEGVNFNLVNYKGEEDTNLDIFVSKLEKNNTVPREEGPPSFKMTVGRIQLEDSRFRFTDLNKERNRVLHFKELNAEIDAFSIYGPKVDMNIEQLAFLDQTQLQVEELQTAFHYTREQMRFDDLSIETEGSVLRGWLVFDYRREDFKEFTDKVRVSAEFKDSEIAFSELNYFYDEFGNRVNAHFNTKLSGVLNNLAATGLDLRSKNTTVEADINLINLFESDRPFSMVGDFRTLATNYYEMSELLPGLLGKSLPPDLAKLGTFTANGKAKVMASTIDLGLFFNTQLGAADANLLLTDLEDAENVIYDGRLVIEDFDLGTLLEDEALGLASFDLEVNGKSFERELLNTHLKGSASRFGYNGYDYTGLTVSGVMEDQLFDGTLLSEDPNMRMMFSGLADFSEERRKFNFNATVSYADLKKTHFLERDSLSIFKGNVEMNMVGTTLDDTEGEVHFTDTYYSNQNDDYFFEDFTVTSRFDNSERTLAINSPDIVSGKVVGSFRFQELPTIFTNAIGSIYSNYLPTEVSAGQYANFDFVIYNKIVEVFFPQIELGNNTTVRGNFDADEDAFKVAFSSPSLTVQDLGGVSDINFIVDSKNPLYNTYVEMGNMDMGFYRVSNFNLINTKINDTLFFRSEFRGGDGAEDLYNFNFFHTIDPERRSIVGLKPSDVTFKGNTWQINELNDKNHKVIINRQLDTFLIKETVMNHESERIALSGELFGEKNKDIQLSFKELDLRKILPDIDSLYLEGTLTGDAKVLQKNGAYLPSTDLIVEGLSVNHKALGDLKALIKGNEDLTRYGVDVRLTHDRLDLLKAQGDITSEDDNNPTMNIDIALDNLDISPFSPIGEEVVTNFQGFLSGRAILNGALEDPLLNGSLQLANAKMYVPYLNIGVAFGEKATIDLYERTFAFNKLPINDVTEGTDGILDGTITHKAFSDWALDLSLSSDHMLVMNTEKNEGSLYYGKAYMDGTASIRGPSEQLSIDVIATTSRGTSIKIPLDDLASIRDNSFITFIDKHADEEAMERINREKDYGGLSLSFDLDITPAAEIEIIMDEKLRSSIRGRGAGTLLLKIADDQFNMWGDLITFEGSYDYKFRGIISKRFEVVPGGYINWAGNPYNPQLSIEAIYKVPGGANPAILLDNPTYKRKIPTNVVIALTGPLESLDEPAFEVVFPNAGGVVESELSYRLNDAESKRLQAISLLAQGSFMSQVALSDSAVRSNVFESVFSNVNAFFRDEDGKFSLGFNYSAGQRYEELNLETDDVLSVSLSSEISERILINGQLGVPVGGVNQTSVVGNVQIELLINEDGTFRAKVFNRENELQYIGEEIGYTQGAGISYQVDFDTLGELWQKIFPKKGKEEEEQEETSEQSLGGVNFSNKGAEKN